MKSQDVAFWKEIINDEMDSIMGNNTWVLTDLPPGCRPLGCKWIFKRKIKVDGTVERFKARLVIQGFKQKSVIDYFDTYAPVVRISTIRLLIALALIHSLIIHQMDIKTAFLNGVLEEEVYMNQPLGFILPGNENKVCKLIKSLYGLKQAPKQWHQKFDEVVLSNGYLLNQADKFVYSKFDASGKGVIICLYVDDMLIFGTDQVQVDLTKEFLSLRFSLKDMGEADVIMGIRIKHKSNGIAISQSHYIEKVLKKFNYSDCILVSTPLDTCEKLMPNRGLAVSQLEYSRVIGCLMYAMTCTRPDIAFAVGKLSRYTSNPGTQHWQAIQRVLKYLKKTMDYRLVYSGYPSVLEGYTDASWISNTEDNSSTSGWVFLLGSGAISLASKKQTCITGSTMESEFVALAAAGKEAEWLKKLLLEIPLWVKPMTPITIRCDNAATLAKAYSQMYNGLIPSKTRARLSLKAMGLSQRAGYKEASSGEIDAMLMMQISEQ
ncbi:zinc finger, CCHC-type containing protein [Tanacetum coccineum]